MKIWINLLNVRASISTINDSNTSVESLKSEVMRFVEARDWSKSHNPKDLSIAISIEIGELLELFLFKNKSKVAEKLKNNPMYRERIAEELADVLIYSLELAEYLKMDVSRIIRTKLEKNSIKYPLKK